MSKKKRLCNKVLVFVIMSVLVYLGIYINVLHGLHKVPYYDYEDNDDVSDYATAACLYDTETIQQFTADSYYLHGINYIMIGLPDGCDGNMKVQIDDMHGKLLKETNILYSEVEAGQWQNLRFDVKLQKGKEYQIIFTNCNSDITPQFLTGTNDTLRAHFTSLKENTIEREDVLYLGMGFCPEVDKKERYVLTAILLLLFLRCCMNAFQDKWIQHDVIQYPDWLKRKEYAVIIGGIIGAICFVAFWGTKVLNPTYVDWLLSGRDLTQHYLGWEFYRSSDWHFPIGLIDNIVYPNKVSVIFTDSISLLAVVFKVIDSIFKLPDKFQYFGMWGLGCLILHGGVAAAILKRHLDNLVDITLGTILVTFSPILIYRMFYHTSLTAHWLILLGIYLFDNCEEMSNQYIIRMCIILGILCSLIHIYFLPMVGAFVLLVSLVKCIGSKKISCIFKYPLSFGVPAILVIYILGGFYGDGDLISSGLGRFGFNLNGLFNPMGYSSILADLPVYKESQKEGLAYLGLGVIILVLFTLLDNILKNANEKEEKKSMSLKMQLLLLTCIFFILFAMSPQITFHDNVIFSINISHKMEYYWSIFRATGRLIWPVCYLIILFGIIGDKQYISRKMKTGILILCVCIQVIDLHDIMIRKSEKFTTKVTYENMITGNNWNQLTKAKNIKHIVFLSEDIIYNQELLYAIADYAVKRNMTISNFYLARSIGDGIEVATIESIYNPSEDNIYIGHICDTNEYRVYSASEIRLGRHLEDNITTF